MVWKPPSLNPLIVKNLSNRGFVWDLLWFAENHQVLSRLGPAATVSLLPTAAAAEWLKCRWRSSCVWSPLSRILTCQSTNIPNKICSVHVSCAVWWSKTVSRKSNLDFLKFPLFFQGISIHWLGLLLSFVVAIAVSAMPFTSCRPALQVPAVLGITFWSLRVYRFCWFQHIMFAYYPLGVCVCVFWHWCP